MANKDDEQILVIKSDIIFSPRSGTLFAGKDLPAQADGKWQGLKTDNLDYYIDLINKNYEFKRRRDMENDPSFQQIIAYILFSFGDKFFAYKYIKNAGERRLVNNDYQLGVGGHINKEDIGDGNDILETGMMREWAEEVEFKGNLISKKLVGIINDESRPVERVHIGLVYHFMGDSSGIQVKEIDKMEGALIDIKDLSGEEINHGPWMKIVYNEYLCKL